MGVYLSVPHTEVEVDSGSGNGLEYCTGDMQGWRKTMEDAHMAYTDLSEYCGGDNSVPLALFGVFDGHGGKEVAKFAEARFVHELVKCESFLVARNWNSSNATNTEPADEENSNSKDQNHQSVLYGEALRECFHRIDMLLFNPAFNNLLKRYRALPHPSDIRKHQQRVKGGAAVATTGITKQSVEQVKTAITKELHVLSETELPANREMLDAEFQPPEAATKLNAEGVRVCNLKDHRVIAGCTSVVLIKNGNDLIVANAGDSRAVLCRADGEAYPLSYDHKPSHALEKTRIITAGGYINQVGRINGNLNLSRSLGDLKYKAISGITASQQMITAEPDITITRMLSSDEFIIIGCDGIWDVLTSQQACDFVRQRLSSSPPASLMSIVEEVCMYCLSENPKKDTGLGTDNMTCMIVLLNTDGSSSSATATAVPARNDCAVTVDETVSNTVTVAEEVALAEDLQEMFVNTELVEDIVPGTGTTISVISQSTEVVEEASVADDTHISRHVSMPQQPVEGSVEE